LRAEATYKSERAKKIADDKAKQRRCHMQSADAIRLLDRSLKISSAGIGAEVAYGPTQE
jgi:hypothetical protein